jgi:hypothetical protein
MQIIDKWFLRICTTLLLMITVSFCWWYMGHSHAEVANLYLEKFSPFYRATSWTKDFFTQQTKYFGNIYCIMVLTISLLITIYTWQKSIRLKINILPSKWPKLSMLDCLIAFVCILQCGFWAWSTPYSTDEIFSAAYFTEKSAIHTLTYYPLPNNHILFNLINIIFYHFIGNSLISGRIISMLCYILTMVLVHRFISKCIVNRTISILAIMAISSQFMIVGFGTQARGYAMLMLFSWLAFESLWYFHQSKNPWYRLIYVIASACGMIVMPSYLYLWLGLSLGFLLCNFRSVDTIFSFFKLNVLVTGLVMIFYAPTIMFSGWEALLNNKYVTIGTNSLGEFITITFMGGYFVGLFDDILGTGIHGWAGGVICIGMIVGLYRSKSNINRRLSKMILGIIIGFVVFLLVMKKIPFYRNMIGHTLLLWVCIVICILGLLENSKHNFKLGLIIFVSIIGWNIHKTSEHYPFHLYYSDNLELENRIKLCEMNFNSYEKVQIDDDRFYWHYNVISNDVKLIHGEPILENISTIVIPTEKVPTYDAMNWKTLKTCGETTILGSIK